MILPLSLNPAVIQKVTVQYLEEKFESMSPE